MSRALGVVAFVLEQCLRAMWVGALLGLAAGAAVKFYGVLA